jgi:hypothetical protein
LGLDHALLIEGDLAAERLGRALHLLRVERYAGQLLH